MGLEQSAVKTNRTVWWSGFVWCSEGCAGHSLLVLPTRRSL